MVRLAHLHRSATVSSDATLTFTLRSDKSTSTTVPYTDALQLNSRVWDANDRLVWRSGTGEAFAPAATMRSLAPGELMPLVEHE